MATGAALAISAATGVYTAARQEHYNKAMLNEQRSATQQQQAEIDRQKKREIEQQKRENQQLMNSISNLTNTSYGGVSSPSIDYDKYGDLG